MSAVCDESVVGTDWFWNGPFPTTLSLRPVFHAGRCLASLTTPGAPNTPEQSQQPTASILSHTPLPQGVTGGQQPSLRVLHTLQALRGSWARLSHADLAECLNAWLRMAHENSHQEEEGLKQQKQNYRQSGMARSGSTMPMSRIRLVARCIFPTAWLLLACAAWECAMWTEYMLLGTEHIEQAQLRLGHFQPARVCAL